jgi:hypothetical protein
MKTYNSLLLFVCLIAVLAAVASLVGLTLTDDGGPFAFTTVRGEIVRMYGQGLYSFETERDGAGWKGADLYVLLVGLPLLIFAALLYRRGSLQGGLLLTGTLGYYLYNSVSMAVGYAYNNLFLVYVALMSLTLFAFILAFLSFDLPGLPSHFAERLPRRGISTFLFIVGVSLIFVWGVMDILPALVNGQTPTLTGHTTLPTHALDMGIIAPVSILSGFLLLRREPLGYLLASTLLIVSAVLGGGVLALSAAQVLAQVLTAAQIMVFVVPFLILTLVAVGLTIILLRNVTEDGSIHQGAGSLKAAHAHKRWIFLSTLFPR